MLAANEAVAKKLLFAKQPAIYRVHDRPDPDRLVDLREVLESFGYELKGDLAEVPPSAFQQHPEEIEGKPEERLLSDLLLRAQRKAIYSPECRGHYALAAPYYCHFTSPIRRYPDLIVHRQLSELLVDGRPVPAADFEAVNESLASMAKLFAPSAGAARGAGGAGEPALEEDRLHEGQGRTRVRRVRHRGDIIRRVRDAARTSSSRGSCRCRRSGRTSSCTRRSSIGCAGDRAGRPTGSATPCGCKLKAIDEVRRRLDFVLPTSPRRPDERAAAAGGPARRGGCSDDPEIHVPPASWWRPCCFRLPRAGPAGAGTSGWPISHDREEAPGRRAGARSEGGSGAGASPKVPTRLEVPPEVAKAYSAVRMAWKDSGSGKEGTSRCRSAARRKLPDSGLEVRGDVFLPAFTMASGRDHFDGGRGGPTRRRASTVAEKGQGDLQPDGSSRISPTCTRSSTPASLCGSSEASRSRRRGDVVKRSPSPLPSPGGEKVFGRHRGAAERRQVRALQPPAPAAPLARARPSRHDPRRPRGGGAASDGRAYRLVDTGGYDPEGRGAIPWPCGTRRSPRFRAPTSSSSSWTRRPACCRATGRPRGRSARRARDAIVAANKIDRKEGSEGEVEAWELGFAGGLRRLGGARDRRGRHPDGDRGEDARLPRGGRKAEDRGGRARGRSRSPSSVAPTSANPRSSTRSSVEEQGDRLGDRRNDPRLRGRGSRARRPAVPARGHGGDPAEGAHGAGAGGPVGRLQARKRIEECDVGGARLDAAEGPSGAGRDGRLSVRRRQGKGLVLIGNKWDIAGRAGEDAAQEFPGGARVSDPLRQPRSDASRLGEDAGGGSAGVLDAAARVAENRRRRITTGELNRVLGRALRDKPPRTASGRTPQGLLRRADGGRAADLHPRGQSRGAAPLLRVAPHREHRPGGGGLPGRPIRISVRGRAQTRARGKGPEAAGRSRESRGQDPGPKERNKERVRSRGRSSDNERGFEETGVEYCRHENGAGSTNRPRHAGSPRSRPTSCATGRRSSPPSPKGKEKGAARLYSSRDVRIIAASGSSSTTRASPSRARRNASKRRSRRAASKTG